MEIVTNLFEDGRHLESILTNYKRKRRRPESVDATDTQKNAKVDCFLLPARSFGDGPIRCVTTAEASRSTLPALSW
jgi:hypothetical protein